MASDGLARQRVVTAVAIAFTSCSVLIVALRVYTRAFLVRSFGKDDFAMLAALLFQLSYLATIIVQRYHGMGFSGKDLSESQMTEIIQTTVAVEVVYYLCVNSIKISILLFYLRLLLKDITRKLCKATITFLVTFCVVCVVVTLTQCIPLRTMWDFTGMVKGKCIDTTAFFYMTSVTNVVIDIWILLLPVEFLIRIERPTREKSALICIFALGALSCISSIIRLYTIRIYTESTDPFADAVPINTWSMVEINTGIYCACLPALKALISKARRNWQRAPTGTFHLRDTGDSERGGKVARLQTHSLS